MVYKHNELFIVIVIFLKILYFVTFWYQKLNNKYLTFLILDGCCDSELEEMFKIIFSDFLVKKKKMEEKLKNFICIFIIFIIIQGNDIRSTLSQYLKLTILSFSKTNKASGWNLSKLSLNLVDDFVRNKKKKGIIKLDEKIILKFFPYWLIDIIYRCIDINHSTQFILIIDSKTLQSSNICKLIN